MLVSPRSLRRGIPPAYLVGCQAYRSYRRIPSIQRSETAVRQILVLDIYRKESAYDIYPASRHPWRVPVYWFKLACPRNSYLDKSHQKLLTTFFSSIPTFQMDSKDYHSVTNDELEDSYGYSGVHHYLQRTNKWGVRLILLTQLLNTVWYLYCYGLCF
jgi:hypothetical protein